MTVDIGTIAVLVAPALVLLLTAAYHWGWMRGFRKGREV